MKKIDTTKTPSLPFTGAIIESHDTSLGKIRLDKLELYLSPNQEGNKYIEGHKLREELKDKPVLNATVLDYLWEHQDQIPESWKEKTKDGNIRFIYFWGTIYRSPAGGSLWVRCLCFDDVGEWCRFCRWLGGGFDGGDPAALMASSKSLKSKTLPSDSLNLEFRVEVLNHLAMVFDTLVAEEMLIAMKEGQPTSRLTSLAVQFEKELESLKEK